MSLSWRKWRRKADKPQNTQRSTGFVSKSYSSYSLSDTRSGSNTFLWFVVAPDTCVSIHFRFRSPVCLCWFHGLYRGDSPTQSGVASETQEEATVSKAAEGRCSDVVEGRRYGSRSSQARATHAKQHERSFVLQLSRKDVRQRAAWTRGALASIVCWNVADGSCLVRRYRICHHDAQLFSPGLS